METFFSLEGRRIKFFGIIGIRVIVIEMMGAGIFYVYAGIIVKEYFKLTESEEGDAYKN